MSFTEYLYKNWKELRRQNLPAFEDAFQKWFVQNLEQ